MRNYIALLFWIPSMFIDAQSFDSTTQIRNIVKESKANSKEKEYKNLIKEINSVFFYDDYYVDQFVTKKNYFINFEFNKEPKQMKANENNLLYYDIVTRAIRIDSSEQCYYCDKFLVLKNLYNTIKKYDSLLDKPFDSIQVENAILNLQKVSKLAENNAKLNSQADDLLYYLNNYRKFLLDAKKSLDVLKIKDINFTKESEKFLINNFLKAYPESDLKSKITYTPSDIQKYSYFYKKLLNFKENKETFDTNAIIQD